MNENPNEFSGSTDQPSELLVKNYEKNYDKKKNIQKLYKGLIRNFKNVIDQVYYSDQTESILELKHEIKRLEEDKEIANSAAKKLSTQVSYLRFALIGSLIINAVIISKPSIIKDFNKLLTPLQIEEKLH